MIKCERCHANRCYGHILSTYNIHSIQALDTHLVDDASATWHQLHQDAKVTYEGDYSQLRAAVRDGLPYGLAHRLTYYASNFSPDKALNENVVLGFYDTPISTLNTVPIPPFLDTVAHSYLRSLV